MFAEAETGDQARYSASPPSGTSNGRPNRSELTMTSVLLATISAAAIAGLSQPIAAQATPRLL